MTAQYLFCVDSDSQSQTFPCNISASLSSGYRLNVTVGQGESGLPRCHVSWRFHLSWPRCNALTLLCVYMLTWHMCVYVHTVWHQQPAGGPMFQAFIAVLITVLLWCSMRLCSCERDGGRCIQGHAQIGELVFGCWKANSESCKKKIYCCRSQISINNADGEWLFQPQVTFSDNVFSIQCF